MGKEPVLSGLLFAESMKLDSRYKTRMLEQVVSPAAVTAPGVLLRAGIAQRNPWCQPHLPDMPLTSPPTSLAPE